jgi:iron-sulfur cluster repair protein YtfE (RIC family)
MEVKEMTIADVLKMPLFFENVKRQLTSLWNDREKARKDATRNNTRLRAHVIDRMHNTGRRNNKPGNYPGTFPTLEKFI